MIGDLLKRDITRVRSLRLLVIVVATWLIGSALFAPWLNPLMRPMLAQEAETASIMGMVRMEMLMIRDEVEGYYRRTGHWPEQALDIYRVEDNSLLRIEFPEAMMLRFTLGRGMPPESGLRDLRLRLHYADRDGWSCVEDSPALPVRWRPPECQPPSWGSQEYLLAILATSVSVLLALLILLAFADPRLRAIANAPVKLRRQPVADLPRLHRHLGWLRRRRATLAGAGVADEDWREALAYSAADNEARAQTLALRVSARCSRCLGWSLPGDVFEWVLPPSFPVALDHVLVYLPDPDVPARDLTRHLRGVQTGQDVLLVVSADSRTDVALFAHCNDPANLCVGVDQTRQCEWLLHPEPQKVLLNLLAAQLRITRLSPYQTRGGVTRPDLFFGRASLLARVLNREPGNYLLVGGRQIGKTSLMKAIERRFAEHPRVHCRYLALRDHRLAERIAAELQVATDTPLETSIAALARQAPDQRLLLLIDETDLFLRAEAASGYGQLATLRSLSEEGRCHFLLAGFWDLYQAVSVDYASPIRNFGEVIQLGALEHDACVELATRPLARLGVRYAAADLVETVVTACGGRANLIAIVCQHGLEQLGRGERILGDGHIDRALGSDALLDALAGWARLSPDPHACALDRILVYSLALRALQTRKSTSDVASPVATLILAQALDELRAAGADIEAETLRHSFARLQLAYVIRRIGDGYGFAVPLFVRQFQLAEVRALLQRELESL